MIYKVVDQRSHPTGSTVIWVTPRQYAVRCRFFGRYQRRDVSSRKNVEGYDRLRVHRQQGHWFWCRDSAIVHHDKFFKIQCQELSRQETSVCTKYFVRVSVFLTVRRCCGTVVVGVVRRRRNAAALLPQHGIVRVCSWKVYCDPLRGIVDHRCARF
jgi:hypothetical protein